MSSAQPTNQVSYDYSGAKVLVTGGSNGIGYGIAKAFAAAGATVTITGTQAGPGDYENDLSAFQYVQLDVRDRDAIRAVAEGLDGLDVLINNAGANLPGGKSEYEPEVFEETVRINLLSAYDMSHFCMEKLKESPMTGGASIINIASLTTFFGVSVVPAYGAAKAGVSQLAKTLGITWAEHGIRVNAIAAGMIATRMTAIMRQVDVLEEPVMARTPMKRWGTPEDIADCALFLASQGASFFTGQTLIADGGYSVVG